MCGIYGVLSYKDKLKDMNELVDLLGQDLIGKLAAKVHDAVKGE